MRLVGAGREAEVYACGETAVLKLYRPGFGGHQAEAAALRSLDGIAPRLLDVVDRDGRTGLVLERFDGPDMLTLLQRRPRPTTPAPCCCAGRTRCPARRCRRGR